MAAKKEESLVTKTVEATKYQTWKFFGALLMEPKPQADGSIHMALSLTRLQKFTTIVMAGILFGVMCYLWVKEPVIAEGVQAKDGFVTMDLLDRVPDSMLQVFWGLLGLAGFNAASSAYEKSKM